DAADHEHEEPREAQHAPAPKWRATVPWDIPDVVQSGSQGIRDGRSSPETTRDAKPQGQQVTVEGMHVPLDVRPDHGELRERRMDQRGLSIGPVPDEEA